jgi:hypothetical protein
MAAPALDSQNARLLTRAELGKMCDPLGLAGETVDRVLVRVQAAQNQ